MHVYEQQNLYITACFLFLSSSTSIISIAAPLEEAISIDATVSVDMEWILTILVI